MAFKNDKLTKEIESRGMSKQAIADALGVSYMAVWRWMNGERDPGVERLYELLGHLGYDDATRQAQRLTDWYTVNGEG